MDRHRGVHQADPDRFAGGGNILFLFVAVNMVIHPFPGSDHLLLNGARSVIEDFEGGFPRSCVFIPAVSDVNLKETRKHIILKVPGQVLCEEQDIILFSNLPMHEIHDFGHGFI